MSLPTPVELKHFGAGLALDVTAPEVLALASLRDHLGVVVLAPPTTHALTVARVTPGRGALSGER